MKKSIITINSTLLVLGLFLITIPLSARVTFVATAEELSVDSQETTHYAVVDYPIIQTANYPISEVVLPTSEPSVMTEQNNNFLQSCPETPYHIEPKRHPCHWRGIVDSIALEHDKKFIICHSETGQKGKRGIKQLDAQYDSQCPVRVAEIHGSRINVSLDGEDFYFLIKDKMDRGASGIMSLFTASRIHKMPVTVSFENWGGEFYIYDVKL